MPIISKAKTVPAWNLDWSVYSNRFSAPIENDTKPNGMAYITGYKSGPYDPGIEIGSVNFKVYDSRFGYTASGLDAFKQYLQDNQIMLTYETVDTVEESIVSYHLPQLVNGSMNEDYAIITGQRVIIPKTDSAIAGTSVNKLNIPVPAGHKVLNFARFIRGNAGTKTINFGGYHLETTTKSWQGGANVPTNRDLSGQTVSVFFTVTAPITDMWIFTRWSGDIVTEEIEFIWTFVDLTQLYGAGNEPTWLEKFLSDHPEYNNEVPYYDGPTLLEEEIK